MYKIVNISRKTWKKWCRSNKRPPRHNGYGTFSESLALKLVIYLPLTNK